MNPLSASKLELAQRCIGAFAIPWQDHANPYREEGKQRHADDEAAIATGFVPAELEAAWPGFTWRAEVAFAYDIATGEGRELGQGIDRDYSSTHAHEIPGTADVVGVKRDDQGQVIALVVVDKKSFDEITPAKSNPQVRFLALAACRTYGIDQVDIGITHEIQPLDRAHLDDFDLEVTAQMVRNLKLRVRQAQDDHAAGKPVSFVPGKQCRWCDGFWNCPQQQELRALLKTPQVELQIVNGIALQDDADAADAYELYRRLGMFYKRLRETIHGRAEVSAIPLPSGKVFGPHDRLGAKAIDGDVAYEVLRAQHGQEVADAAVSREASQASIERALRTVARYGELSGLKRSALAEIEAKGGLSQKTERRFEEHWPARELAAASE